MISIMNDQISATLKSETYNVHKDLCVFVILHRCILSHSKIFQFSNHISIDNERSDSCSVKFIHTMNK